MKVYSAESKEKISKQYSSVFIFQSISLQITINECFYWMNYHPMTFFSLHENLRQKHSKLLLELDQILD